MSKQKQRLYILVKGGILTPSYLMLLTGIAKESGNETIGFGSRQQVILDVFPSKKAEVEKKLKENGFEFEWDKNGKAVAQNIVSSFPAYDIQPSTYWLGASTFISILEQFNAPVSIKVNIVDAKQNLVPNYGGHLNFIASEQELYWHLVIKNLQGKDMTIWPALVHQDDIAKLVYTLESYYKENRDFATWFDDTKAAAPFKYQEASESIPDAEVMPEYYEGFNLMYGSTKYWAGFYWRNNKYLISFLEEVCELCLRCGIARLSITPWKSFLVKDINRADRLLWEQLTGRRGVNMRHSSFDLFWHLPYGSESALKLKQSIVREMDKRDIRTFGLTFAIGKDSFPIASVILEERYFLNRFNIPLLNDYTIWIAADFQTKSGKYEKVSENISRKEIYNVLIELSKRFYLKLNQQTVKKKEKVEDAVVETDEVFQCSDCLSIYHPRFGEEQSNVPAGTAFANLPRTFCCATCGAEKNTFKAIQMPKMMFAAQPNDTP